MEDKYKSIMKKIKGGCKGKVPYSTQKEALGTLRRWNGGKTNNTIYRCSIDSAHWHITSQSKSHFKQKLKGYKNETRIYR